MNRRAARLVFQALAAGVFADIAMTQALDAYTQGQVGGLVVFLAWLILLGATVGELGILMRFGAGPLWGPGRASGHLPRHEPEEGPPRG